MATQRLSLTMNEYKSPPPGSDAERPTARADRFAVWILLALGLLLMLVSAGKAETTSATRVDRFNGTVRAGQTVQVENISGDIVATSGAAFSAVVTVTVSAESQKRAEEILAGTRILNEHGDEGWSFETRWPGMHTKGPGSDGLPCRRCSIVARYEIVLPPGVTAEFQTVNGAVRVRDTDGELRLESVNGSIEARGVRRAIEAQTVNGKIDATVETLPAGMEVGLESVNGSVTLTLPKDARFHLTAETMNGTIASTFPLPRSTAGPGSEETPRPSKKIIVQTEGDETQVVDLEEIERELEESMRDVDVLTEEDMREANEAVREARREIRRMRIADPRREYSGAIGRGGAPVRLETLNGSVLLLAAGTKESDAKPLVSEHRSFVVTVPEVRVRVPQPPRPPSPPAPPVARVPAVPPVPPVPEMPDLDGEIVRGNISGDFLSNSTGDSYRIGRVSGRVKIVTHSGEILVEAAGASADLKTFGGDIVIGPVQGDLRASTMAGDIRAEAVSGSVSADTAGGDIRIASAGGALDAKTAGGDVIVPSVGGSVRAATAGGDVRIGVTARHAPGGVAIHNSGGDVSLTLPADFKASVELIVTGADDGEMAIRSDFPDLTISRRHGTHQATGTLNGGGEKVIVRTSSGTIRLRKAP